MDDSSPVANQPRVEEVVEAVVKECRKESLPYKQEAVAAAGAILEVQDVDRFAEMNSILKPLLTRVNFNCSQCWSSTSRCTLPYPSNVKRQTS